MQSELIDLGNHILEFGDWVPTLLRPMYFEVLHKIIARGEMSLASLSLFNVSSDPKISKKIMDKKVDVAADYELFIYKVLKFCIKTLNLRGVDLYK